MKTCLLCFPLRICWVVWLACLLAAGAFAAPAETLQSVVIVSRHGVRAPINTPEQLAPFAAEPWPAWEVPAGYLTPRGKELVTLMGKYYRARYIKLGLLSGSADKDGPRIFYRTNNIQRTQETGRGLSLGLTGDPQPDLHLAPDNKTDVLFTPGRTRMGNPDVPLAIAAERARMGSDPDQLAGAYRTQLDDLNRVLFGPDNSKIAPGKIVLSTLPITIQPGTANDFVVTAGVFSRAMTITENFALEYANGRPASEVGWGRVDRARLAELFQLHALNFDLTQRTLYPAQVESSNLANHLWHTLAQGVSGQMDPEGIGGAFHPLTIFVAHDTNLVNLGGLLGATWTIDGLPSNPTLPGGALVFELWKHEEKFFVRTYYISQTLDQMRNVTTLSLETPPAATAVFIPGCSTTGTDFESPWADFEKKWSQVIDRRYVKN